MKQYVKRRVKNIIAFMIRFHRRHRKKDTESDGDFNSRVSQTAPVIKIGILRHAHAHLLRRDGRCSICSLAAEKSRMIRVCERR